MESPLSPCSSPSTPQPERDQSSPHPVGPSSAPASPNIPGPVSPRPELGSLDLKPCSLEEYFEIDTSVYGRYEYVEGILVAIPMADENHDDLADYLRNTATARYIDKQGKHLSGSQQGLAIPNSPSTSGNSARRQTIRRPDLSFGSRLSQSERSNLSPRSRKISNPVFGKVENVIEITSHNGKTDTEIKPREYEKAGVKMYAVVDRNITCKDESKRDQHVVVYRRDSPSQPWSSKESFRGDDLVDLGPYGTYKTSKLFSKLDPEEPIKQLVARKEEEAKKAKEREQELMTKIEELQAKHEEDAKKAKKRERELRAQYEEEVKEVKEREQKLRAKKKHYKSVVRKSIPEEEVSSSGSSRSSRTNSPVRKRAKC